MQAEAGISLNQSMIDAVHAHSPDGADIGFRGVRGRWTAGRNQLVYARLAADLDTPVSVMMKLTDAGRDSFIL